MDKERLYRLQLAALAEVMPRACRRLLDEFGSAERVCTLQQLMSARRAGNQGGTASDDLVPMGWGLLFF